MCAHRPADVPLFFLIPMDDEARLVVDCNPEHAVVFRQERTIPCYPNRPSKIQGCLLSFGRSSNNDIRLPSGPTGSATTTQDRRVVQGGGSYQNYRDHHFYFLLAPSGELILRDLSPGLTRVDVEGASPKDESLYTLHGHGASPRQRVIPRTERAQYVTFGTRTMFRLSWNPGYVPQVQSAACPIQDRLAAYARALRAGGGLLLGIPEADGPGSAVHPSHDNWSSRASRGSGPGGYRPLFKYGPLAQGELGRVSKAVELASGELFAVKEIRGERKREDSRWKAILTREVEAITELLHPNLVLLEAFQDTPRTADRGCQLVFRLYRGSLQDLISPHNCDSMSPYTAPPPYWDALVEQIVSALDYLHSKGVLHGNIKPTNIMYDHSAGSPVPDFFLGDFGLSETNAAIWGGRRWDSKAYYGAPEIWEDNVSAASDVWSLAVTLGQARGFWCDAELNRSTNFWIRKLRRFGWDEPAFADKPEAQGNLRWAHRLLALVANCRFPKVMAAMLRRSPAERPTASQLRRISVELFDRI